LLPALKHKQVMYDLIIVFYVLAFLRATTYYNFILPSNQERKGIFLLIISNVPAKLFLGLKVNNHHKKFSYMHQSWYQLQLSCQQAYPLGQMVYNQTHQFPQQWLVSSNKRSIHSLRVQINPHMNTK